MNLKRKFLFALTIFFVSITSSYASHGTDSVVDSILGDGNGVFVGSLVHGSVHPWYTFDLDIGDMVSLNLSTPSYDSYLWLYEVLNEPLTIGDLINTDYSLVSQGGGGTNNSLFYTALQSGQFAVQLDSFLSGQGAYTFTVSGAKSVDVPEPSTLAIFMLALVGLSLRKFKRINHNFIM